VDAGPGVVGAMSARVGSDPNADELVQVVVAALRGAVADDTWSGMVEELPFSIRAALRSGTGRGDGARSWDELVRTVAARAQHPPARAAWYVRAVFASLKSTLPRGLADAVAAELPGELAAAWRSAR
jgi:uncharacterized protein (DUF2267 family)